MKKLFGILLVFAGSLFSMGLDKEGILSHGISQVESDSVKLAIDLGANLERRDDFGMTALMGAAWKGDRSICEMLLGANALLDAKVETGDLAGYTAWRIAKQLGLGEVVALLEERGCAQSEIGAMDLSEREMKQRAVNRGFYWTLGKGFRKAS